MKIFCFLLFTIFSQLTFAQSGDLNNFFSQVVEGKNVNYKKVKNEFSKELSGFITQINSNIGNTPSAENLANYINLYNLLVINQITSNYPLNSPNEVPGFFDQTKFSVNGKEITLNELENEIIRPTYNDARVHFALVCGAKGCPPIQSFAYDQASIDTQLNLVTKAALNDANFIKEKENTHDVSEIFRWYAVDFGNSEKNIVKFINQYREKPIAKISYYPYDWTLNDVVELSNIATYTPSVLLKSGQFEVVIFNNLYTQDGGFNENGERIKSNQRNTWNTTMMTFNYGVSKTGRYSIGLDVNLRSVRNDNPDNFAANIFRFEQNDNNRTTISSIGPKIKWSPLKSVPKFSMQSTFWIPVSQDMEGTPWLDWQRYTSWTQFFYDKTFGTKYQLFTELAAWVRLPEIGSDLGLNKTVVETPISTFFSYFPTGKSTIYTQLQYWPVLSDFPAYFAQAGLGGKYQLFKKLQVEASYTNFFAGQRQGAGATFNFGLRYISN